MFAELSLLIEAVPTDSPIQRYREAVVEENLLGKATRSNRQDTANYLTSLYSLNRSVAVFRLLRHFWSTEGSGRPMIAYLAATARDPLLRECSDLILGVPHDETFGFDRRPACPGLGPGRVGGRGKDCSR
jgi:hypothetical protein